VTKPAFGPKRFFFYSLFESDVTGAPLAVRNRAAGSIDTYAASVGRWLVTRDGFDFLAYYLTDFDYASHAHGPLGADDVALERTDAAIQALLDAAGGPERSSSATP
jgi:Type I phosphodiesterase / nucleotide pyrophosphatase.